MAGLNNIEVVNTLDTNEELKGFVREEVANAFGDVSEILGGSKSSEKNPEDYPEGSFERYKLLKQKETNSDIKELWVDILKNELITGMKEDEDTNLIFRDLLKNTGRIDEKSSTDNLIEKQIGANLDLLSA